MKYLRMIGIVLIGLLILTACGGDDTSDSNDASAPERPVIKLAEMPWISAQANVNVAKILLEEQLGYTVELVPVEGTEQWDMMAVGDLHVQMEIWPSSSTDKIQQYIVEEQSIEDGGELGPVGRGGWYVPYYLLEDYPSLRSWEAYKDPEIVQLFATAETGAKGQLISGDPNWLHSQYAETLIQNLALELEIVYAGTEAAELEMIQTAFDNEAPILVYFWTPHWVYALYDLAEIELPPYSDECYAVLEEIACAYPADHLRKAFWAGLNEYAPDAYQLLKNFNYTTHDQIQIMAQVEIDGKSVENAAREWLNANESTWQAWLPQ